MSVRLNKLLAQRGLGARRKCDALIQSGVVRVNGGPVVSITAPASGSSYLPGTAVPFTATASDFEDGDLTAGLTWRSSRDGTAAASVS